MNEEVTYLEFEDEEDSRSMVYKDEERTSFRIMVQPEMYLLALIDDPKTIQGDVLPAVRQLMDAAYEQGKQLGKSL